MLQVAKKDEVSKLDSLYKFLSTNSYYKGYFNTSSVPLFRNTGLYLRSFPLLCQLHSQLGLVEVQDTLETDWRSKMDLQQKLQVATKEVVKNIQLNTYLKSLYSNSYVLQHLTEFLSDEQVCDWNH